MDSLKVTTIRTTFDTLDNDDQRKLAMDLMLHAWGLCKEVIGFMAATTHPLAHMTWIHKVCGDISMDEWSRAIASYSRLHIKSARMYCNPDGSDKHVYLYPTDLVPQYATLMGDMYRSELTEDYETFDQFLKNCDDATWWLTLEGDMGYDYLKDKLLR